MKKEMVNQLTLGVGLKDEATFQNFYAGKNENIVRELTQISLGYGNSYLYLYGTVGEGASHLLQACCHFANQHNRTSLYLPMEYILDFTPDIFEGVESFDLVCIDDIQNIANKAEWEEAFFHIYNRIIDNQCRLIVSGNASPKNLQLKLPDIVSRLNGGMIFQLQPLTDGEKLKIMIMRAERRGINISEEVGRYILNRLPRGMSQLITALDALDKVSLAAQRKVTIPFVKAVLQIS